MSSLAVMAPAGYEPVADAFIEGLRLGIYAGLVVGGAAAVIGVVRGVLGGSR